MKDIDSNPSSICSPSTHFKNALAFSKKGNFMDAVKSLDTAIILSNNSPFYIYQKIRLQFQSEQFRDCSKFIVAQLSHLYKQGSLYIFCRSLDLFQKMNHYTIDELAKLLSYYHIPIYLAHAYEEILFERKRPFYELAHKAMDQGHYLLCLDYCELYQKVFPNHADIVYMRAYSYHMLGQLQRAQIEYLTYLEMRPSQPYPALHLAFTLMELGDYATAASFLKKSLQLEPNNVELLLYLGECYYTSKDYDLALSIYKMIEKIEPDNLQNLFNLVHLYNKLNKNWISRHYSHQINKMLKKRRAS